MTTKEEQKQAAALAEEKKQEEEAAAKAEKERAEKAATPSVAVTISQNAADELYRLAETPRIVAFDLSSEVRAELLALRPPEPEQGLPGEEAPEAKPKRRYGA